MQSAIRSLELGHDARIEPEAAIAAYAAGVMAMRIMMGGIRPAPRRSRWRRSGEATSPLRPEPHVSRA
jgi:hypothetical protein